MTLSAFQLQRGRSLALATAATCAALTHPAYSAEQVHELAALRVIAAPGVESLRTEMDPGSPAQPIPAQDGADILQTIPGFSIIRKGGISGDPLFRGMAGSRLGIVVDGENILGGCGQRMDPPTAYVYPANFDSLTFLKGPQSVVHGPGNSAGVVLFERQPVFHTEANWQATGALTLGSWGRNDQNMELQGGNPVGYAQLNVSRAEADNYEDGEGSEIHSAYRRWSVNGALGWTPDVHTRVDLSGTISDAEAAYADRAMDGSEFARVHLGAKFERSDLSPLLQKLSAIIYFNEIDHVMDNFSLREFTPSMMMPNPVASNPDRQTWGGRIRADLVPAFAQKMVVGADYQANDHSIRRSMNENMRSYRDLPREQDAEFEVTGLFAELGRDLATDLQWTAGLRLDYWETRDLRTVVAVGMMNTAPNPTAGMSRTRVLGSGFTRLERTLGAATRAYFGYGHVQRFPDYWELFSKESADSLSAFNTQPEKVHQLDLGLQHQRGPLSLAVALFVNHTDNYILIQSGVKAMPMGSRSVTIARNIDARSFGGEASASWRIHEHWRAEGSLAYVRGSNRTDNLPLAQQPPLEAKLGISYTSGPLALGALGRFVASQSRVAIGQGNIVGQDLGPSQSFAVFSVNAALQIRNGIRLLAGIDNLFDRAYAEHLSRAGSDTSGLPAPTLRLQEPGRQLWARAEFRF